MTKLTSDTAFRVTFHRNMRPAMWTRVRKTMRVMMMVENILKPLKMKEPPATTKRDQPIACKVAVQIDKYCSKNT